MRAMCSGMAWTRSTATGSAAGRAACHRHPYASWSVAQPRNPIATSASHTHPLVLRARHPAAHTSSHCAPHVRRTRPPSHTHTLAHTYERANTSALSYIRHADVQAGACVCKCAPAWAPTPARGHALLRLCVRVCVLTFAHVRMCARCVYAGACARICLPAGAPSRRTRTHTPARRRTPTQGGTPARTHAYKTALGRLALGANRPFCAGPPLGAEGPSPCRSFKQVSGCGRLCWAWTHVAQYLRRPGLRVRGGLPAVGDRPDAGLDGSSVWPEGGGRSFGIRRCR
jgi:hypothetical protein